MNLEQGPGPHATPLVHRGVVYAAGAMGHLHALEADSGELVWRHRLIENLGGTVVTRGYSSSPVADSGLVIAQTGGDGHAVTAFDAATGRIVWRSGSFENVNASPIVADIGGARQVVALGADGVVGLDAGTGHVRWTHPHPHRFGDNIPMPLWSDGLLAITSYADGGTRVLELDIEADETRVRELWHHRRFRVYYTNVLRLGDRLYGSSGDLGPTVFTAVDVRTGEVAWQTRDLARSNFITVSGRLILRDDQGRLVLADVHAEGVTVGSAVPLFEPGPPSPPTLRGSRLYVRDRRIIMALEVG
jgi:outer membrane protein assembly factor BamB